MIRHQWLLIVVIAVGLVGMHHLLVCTADTVSLTVAPGPGSSPLMTPPASATPIQHANLGPAGFNPVEAEMASPADCCDPMDIVGHLRLAVLTAITSLVAALIFAAAWRRPLESGYLLVAVSAVAARAPPIGCARFTQLCVLRR